MVDMNDPEVIESLKYLLIPKEEKIRLAAQPYNSLKNFFVADHEKGYICAECVKDTLDGTSTHTQASSASPSIHSNACHCTP